MKNRKSIYILGILACLMVGIGCWRNMRTGVIPYINDGNMEWNDISYAEVYVGGCAIPPAFTVEDPETINKLVNSLMNTGKYKHIPIEHYLEGLCNIWIRFSNGVCIGIYDDVNQGYIDKELRATGGPFYKLPQEFWESVQDLIKEQ